MNQFPWLNDVLLLVNKPYKNFYNIDYTPSTPLTKRLYGIMQASSEDAVVTITNVEEKISNFYVNYYLKTDAKCALIQFYFNGKQQLTRALPKSTFGSDDNKLLQLIQKIESHVI